jgi:hypothetical protein
MSCCGGHRAAQRTSHVSSPAPVGHRSSGQVRPVTFEYSGVKAIAVTGPATGATYRFSGKGARLSVHESDAPSLISVPGLRPVR